MKELHAKGVRIVNINLGIDFESEAFKTHQEAIDYSKEIFVYLQVIFKEFPDVLFVIPAGNDGHDNDEIINLPSGFPEKNVLSVASANKRGVLSSYSNYGLKTVDIAARGERIWGPKPGGGSKFSNGTCMAAGNVTRLASKLLEVRRDLTPLQVIEIILSSSDITDGLKGKIKSGGIINEVNALEQVLTL